MEPLLHSLRAALADGATDEQRRAGAAALDSMLAQLAAATAAAPSTPALDVDQMLDIAIARLSAIVEAKARRAAPAEAEAPAPPRPAIFSIPFVPVPRSTSHGR